MVLEDVNNSTPDNFDDNPDPSSSDPYASASRRSGERIDATSLPQPIPLLGPMMGFTAGSVRFKTEQTIQFAEKRINRVLEPYEVQAFAFHIYKLEQTKSYFAAAGLAAGTYRCWSTADSFRYPFYKPKLESIEPNKFGIVRGPLAMYARHSWRFLMYATVSSHLGSIIGQAIAQPVAAVNTSKDPKLEQFGKDVRAADPRSKAEQDREFAQRTRQYEQAVEQRPRNRLPVAKNEDPVDDMNPAAGNEAWGSQSPVTESWETYSNDASQPAPSPQQHPSSMDNRDRRPEANRQSPTSSLPFDDDASPTGGLFQDEVYSAQSQAQSQSPSRSPPQGRPGESTWDRLRRGEAPIPGQRVEPQPRRPEHARKERREGSTLGDSYTFVEGDEERKREKEQAQQEFDARIERERQGRDFSDDEKRW